MTMFLFAGTRPARLTAPVGPGAPNRPHDVALVQTGLRLAKDGSGRPVYAGRIDGAFGSKTRTALAALQQTAAPTEARRPLGNASQALKRLAQGTDIRVLEGSTVPYLPSSLAEPRVTVALDGEVAETTRQALVEIAKRVARETGINLTIRIVPDQQSRDGTLALFDLDALAVVRWNGNRFTLSSAASLAPSERSLKQALAALIGRASEALAPRAESWRLKPGAGLALASLDLGRADGVKRRFEGLVRTGRGAGLTLAARVLERYLSGAGGHVTLSEAEALAFEPIREALAENIRRFNENTFLDPEGHGNEIAAGVLARVTKPFGVSEIRLTDYYDYDFTISIESTNYYELILFAEFDQLLATGQSKFRSLGHFIIQRKSNGPSLQLLIQGTIMHLWRDTYDFAPGFVFGDDALLLAALRGAKPLTWGAESTTSHSGTMRITDQNTREWIEEL